MDNMIQRMIDLLNVMLNEKRPHNIRMVLQETIKKLENTKKINATTEWKLGALNSIIEKQTYRIKEINRLRDAFPDECLGKQIQ